jgi:hypothetical protein
MLKPYRFTLQIPACIAVDAIGQVDPSVSGSSSPSARVTNFSMIAGGQNSLALADLDTYDQRLSTRTVRRLASWFDHLPDFFRRA